jgi:diketogulonate reductase-like aldo/keto reductase
VALSLVKKYSVSAAVVFYRCLSERGGVPLCGTKSEVHMKDDLGFLGFEIKSEEVESVFNLL